MHFNNKIACEEVVDVTATGNLDDNDISSVVPFDCETSAPSPTKEAFTKVVVSSSVVTRIHQQRRNSTTIVHVVQRINSNLKRNISQPVQQYTKKQLVQTQKFYSPLKRWLLGLYEKNYEPDLDTALSDLATNHSNSWFSHPNTMCAVHIIQVQMVIYRQASLYRILETYILTGLPLWLTFVFQGAILLYLWNSMQRVSLPDTPFCRNPAFLELCVLVVYVMYTVVENTERFEANMLVAMARVYGRAHHRAGNWSQTGLNSGSSKKHESRQPFSSSGRVNYEHRHSLLMYRKYSEFMKNEKNALIKAIYFLSLSTVVLDIYVLCAMVLVGSRYIGTSDGVSNIVQSAVALSFIGSLDSIVFKQTYSQWLVDDLRGIYILQPSNPSDWEQCSDDRISSVEKGRNKSEAEAARKNNDSDQEEGEEDSEPEQEPQEQRETVQQSSGERSATSSTDQHVLFLNNTLIYNLLFLMRFLSMPAAVCLVLFLVRYNYCV